MSLKYKKIITNSEIQMFKDCRLAWYFSWVEGLRPIEPSPKLFLGSGVHIALAAYYKETGQKRFASAEKAFTDWYAEQMDFIKNTLHIDSFDSEREQEYNELYNLGIGMLKGYDKFAKENDDFEVIEVEKEYVAPILTPKGFKSRINYKARVDMVIKDEIGYWIVDHKTAKSVDTKIYEIDEQATSYIMATQYALKKPIKGIIYNILKKKLPKEPKLLKDGGLSKAKSIDTTHAAYLEAIQKHGLDLTQYADILLLLKEKGNTFFVREKFYRNENEIANQNRRIYAVAKDMYGYPGSKIYYRVSRDCYWKCAFKDLCLNSQDGSDVDYLKEAHFIKKEVKNET